jgi:tetratricopeptide (TPR) repeat protein
MYGGGNVSILAANEAIAEYLTNSGRYNEAEILYEQALAAKGSMLGQEHLVTAGIMRSLADIYEFQGRYTKAETLYGRFMDLGAGTCSWR